MHQDFAVNPFTYYDLNHENFGFGACEGPFGRSIGWEQPGRNSRVVAEYE